MELFYWDQPNLYIVEVEMWVEQPTIKIAQGSNLGHLRREKNIIRQGEPAQNSFGVAMRL